MEGTRTEPPQFMCTEARQSMRSDQEASSYRAFDISFGNKSSSEDLTGDTFTPQMMMKIAELKKKYPSMHPWHIRKRLLQDPEVSPTNYPSIAAVETMMRCFPSETLERANFPTFSQCQAPETVQQRSNRAESSAHLPNEQTCSPSITQTSYSVESSSEEESISGTIHCSPEPRKEDQMKPKACDTKVPKKFRRPRITFREEQVQVLQTEFQRSHYPDHTVILKLANYLNVDTYRIQIWFANRRAKHRRLEKLRRSDPFPAEEISLEKSSSVSSSYTDGQASEYHLPATSRSMITYPNDRLRSTISCTSTDRLVTHDVVRKDLFALSYLHYCPKPSYFSHSMHSEPASRSSYQRSL